MFAFNLVMLSVVLLGAAIGFEVTTYYWLFIVLALVFIFYRGYAPIKTDPFSPNVVFSVLMVLTYVGGSVKASLYHQIDQAVWTSLFAFCIFIFGFLYADFKSLGPIKSVYRWDVKQVKIIVMGLLAVSLLAVSFMVFKVGIPFLYEDKVQARFESRRQVTSYVIYLIRVSQFALYLWLLGVIRTRIKEDKKALLIAIAMFGLVVIINLMPGWRGPVLIFVLCSSLIWHYGVKMVNTKTYLFVCGVAFTLAFVWGFARIAFSADGYYRLSYIDTYNKSMVMVFLEWVAYQWSAYFLGVKSALWLYPDHIDFKKGIILITAATVLPGKQDTFGEQLKQDLGLGYMGGGLNPSLVGEAYADFGYPSLIIYFFIYGWLICLLHKRALYWRDPASVLIYVYFYSCLMMGVMTGMISHASYIFHALVMLFILKVLGRKPVQRATSLPQATPAGYNRRPYGAGA